APFLTPEPSCIPILQREIQIWAVLLACSLPFPAWISVIGATWDLCLYLYQQCCTVRCTGIANSLNSHCLSETWNRMDRPSGMKLLLLGFLLFQMSKGLMAEDKEEQFLPSDEQFHIHQILRTGYNEQEYLRRQKRDTADTYVAVLEISFADASLGGTLQNVLTGSTELKDALSSIVTLTGFQVSQNVSSITVSPENPFVGDMVTIQCQFSDLTDVSWLHNSQAIRNTDKYNTSNTSALYTLKIKNVNMEDAGSYTCTGPGSPTASLQIRSLSISPTSNIPLVCNGKGVNLTCCSPDISLFNITWTAAAGSLLITGTQSTNSTCSIYTIQADSSQCPSQYSGSVTNYTCTFQGIYGATGSAAVQVTYLKPATVTITGPTSVSAQSSLSLRCQSDVSNIDRVTWSINGLAIATDKQILNKDGSTLTVSPVTMDWNGTYLCTLYQQNLPSSGSCEVKVLNLPNQQTIQVDPISIYQKCGNPQPLNCCIPLDSSSVYTVEFVPSAALQLGNQVTHGQLKCFSANYTATVCPQTAVFTCVISNGITSVSSPQMQITYWSDTEILICPAMQEPPNLPESPNGAQIIIPCQNTNPSLTGNITYTCSNKQWTNQTNCTSVVVFNQYVAVQNLANGPAPAQQMPTFIQSLSNTTQTNKETIASSPTNINTIVNILSIVSDNSKNVQPETMDNFISTVNTIVNNTQVWTTIRDKSSDLLKSVENFAEQFTNVTSYTSNQSNTNIQLKGQTFSANTSYNQTFQLSGLSGGVTIGDGSLSGNSCTVVSIAYSTLKDILPSDLNKTINGLVISTKVVQGTINEGHFNVSISFSQSNDSLTNPDCVFWDFNISGWNNRSCSPSVKGNTTTVCTCNHLTSFAVLMGADDTNIPPEIIKFLEVITYVGLGVSLACLFLTLVIEAIVWKSVIKNKTSYLRHVCLVNIAVSLLVADIFFLIGAHLERFPDTPACTAVGFLSFYFFLVLFFWMLTTGLILFYRLVYILHDTSRKTMMIIAFTLGYGCPAVISIITVASTAPRHGFTSGTYCWLNYTTTKSFLAFVVPVLTIVFVNFVILCVVIFKLLRPNVGERQSKDEKKILVQITKSLAVLTPLLGLTWVFGLFVAAKPKNATYQILFTIFNSFQGLFILISTVLLDQKVRLAMRNTLSWTTQRSKTASTLTSAGSSENSQWKFPKKRRPLFPAKGFFDFSESQVSSRDLSTGSYNVLT
ncbi:hypothetical protein XENTR_v10015056, partial [Xenopus tropicalis]